MTGSDEKTDPHPAALPEQAAHWWVVLHDESCTPADRKAFAAWVQRSPERVEAFLRVSMVPSALRAHGIRWPDTSAEELIRQAQSASAEIIPASWSFRAARPRVFSFRRSMPMLAASFATMLVAVLALWWFIAPSQYETRIGEQRSVVLDDGSIVVLNTASQIEVKYTQRRRFIRLLRGEALFEVAHDTARPFDVSVDAAVVRAVGTQFNVFRQAGSTTVTVVEGKVQVTAAAVQGRGGAGANDPAEAPSEVLAAAQRIVLSERGMSEPERVADLERVKAWTQRRLVFEDQALAEVAAEFNRYNRRRILIESDGLRAQQITGVFQANDADSFLAFISAIPGVSVRITAAGDRAVFLDSSQRNDVGATGGPK